MNYYCNSDSVYQARCSVVLFVASQSVYLAWVSKLTELTLEGTVATSEDITNMNMNVHLDYHISTHSTHEQLN